MQWVSHFLVAVFLACVLNVPAGSAAEPVAVAVPDPGSGRSLQGWMVLGDATDQEVAGLRPAVVFLHGCSGLGVAGTIVTLYRAWADILNEAGYAVLMIDSAGSRGFVGTCGPGPDRAVMYRERPGDAYAGLLYLQALDGIDPERIYLIGWSQGGGIVLLTLNDRSIGRPDWSLEYDFRAGVAFYPAKCVSHLHVAPYTSVAPGTWRTVAPILILQGALDNWTRAELCQTFVDELQGRGEPVEIIVYPHAVHAFDAPNLPLRSRSDAVTFQGEAPLVGTDEDARRAAIDAVLTFLAEHR